MIAKAYAKVNLSLDVLRKREDGYHILKMIMQNIDLYDLINLKITKGKDIVLSCNKKYVPEDKRNLVYKAAELFLKTYNIEKGIYISIKKNIPVAAGLAGGSSDAACTLKLMRDIFKPNLSDKELMKLGLKIGADVPYCILGGTALCEGIGEEVTPIKKFDNYILVLVKPGFGVSTKEVYKNIDVNKIYFHPNTENLIKGIKNNDLQLVCKNMKNVLENVTLRKHKTIKSIKEEMMKYGAINSIMSGSGPTVFGIFEDMLSAQFCYDKMKEDYKEVFITRTI